MFKRLYPIRAFDVKRALLIFAAAPFLWFGGKGLASWLGYARLTEYAPASVQSWEVKEKGSKYLLVARYTFEVQGKTYEGTCQFREPIFLNRLSAEQERDAWGNRPWFVWYSPSSPQFSSLQKLFPYKSLSYALVSFCVLMFFIYRLFRGADEKM